MGVLLAAVAALLGAPLTDRILSGRPRLAKGVDAVLGFAIALAVFGGVLPWACGPLGLPVAIGVLATGGVLGRLITPGGGHGPLGHHECGRGPRARRGGLLGRARGGCAARAPPRAGPGSALVFSCQGRAKWTGRRRPEGWGLLRPFGVEPKGC